MPRSPNLPDQLQYLGRLPTPSAAVGSSRMTTLLPKAAARATATACRWPPESVSTAWPMCCSVPTPSSPSSGPWPACMPLFSNIRMTLPSGPGANLATEKQVGRNVECGSNRQRLVHGFDAGVAGVDGLAELDRVAIEPDFAGVGNYGTGEALINVDLPAPLSPIMASTSPGYRVKVDAVEADDSPVGLHQSLAFEDRRDCRGGGCGVGALMPLPYGSTDRRNCHDDRGHRWPAAASDRSTPARESQSTDSR